MKKKTSFQLIGKQVGTDKYWVLFIGTTPGPIFLGAILDSTCTVWQESCGVRGNCWVYDKWPLGLRLMLWWMGTKLVGFVFLLLASCVYKPESTENQSVRVETSAADNPVFSVLDESNYKNNTKL